MQIAEGWVPGVIGGVASLHAKYYSREWGFGARFESIVARDVAEFIDRYGETRAKIWSAWAGESMVGSIAIDARAADNAACLRWFIVSEQARGHGLGQGLLKGALLYVDEQLAADCYLHTFCGLDAARRLYERHGFSLTWEKPGQTWSSHVIEQRFARPYGARERR